MGSKFKGKCHWCGKIGHKSSECRLRISGKPKVNSSDKGNDQENNSKAKVNRKNLFCTFCKIKGHEVSECRKKKRENQENVGNNFKEVACMATDDSSDPPAFGQCTQCASWGPTFQYCASVEKTAGMIYFPTSLNPSDDTLTDEEIQELMEEDRQAKELLDNNPKIRETLRNNIPYAAFNDVPGLIMQPDEDICAEIPLKKMFEFIHMKTDVGHCLYYETMRDYVEDRCLIMKEFNFRTLPEILLTCII